MSRERAVIVVTIFHQKFALNANRNSLTQSFEDCKNEMTTVSAGREILCENGHVGGRTLRKITVGVDDALLQSDIVIENGGNHTSGGHCCVKCGKPITQYRGGKYRVRTADGWIGSL